MTITRISFRTACSKEAATAADIADKIVAIAKEQKLVVRAYASTTNSGTVSTGESVNTHHLHEIVNQAGGIQHHSYD